MINVSWANHNEKGQVCGYEFANILCTLMQMIHGMGTLFSGGCQECGSGVSCSANNVTFLKGN